MLSPCCSQSCVTPVPHVWMLMCLFCQCLPKGKVHRELCSGTGCAVVTAAALGFTSQYGCAGRPTSHAELLHLSESFCQTLLLLTEQPLTSFNTARSGWKGTAKGIGAHRGGQMPGPPRGLRVCLTHVMTVWCYPSNYISEMMQSNFGTM